MPIGNGPFKMTEPWAHDQYIKVEKIDDYYGDEPNIDGVDYKIFTDQDTAFLEFEAGNLDFTPIPTGQIQSTVDEYGESPDGYTAQPGRADQPRCRAGHLLPAHQQHGSGPEGREGPRALSLAINRQDICDTVFEGTREPATGIVPPGIVGSRDRMRSSTRSTMSRRAKTDARRCRLPGRRGLPDDQARVQHRFRPRGHPRSSCRRTSRPSASTASW